MRPTLPTRLPNAALGALGLGLFLCLWESVGRFQLLGLSWPSLSDVLTTLADPPRAGFFSRALSATLAALASGYLVGLFAGLGAAATVHLAPALKPGFDRLNAVIHAIPSIALAPLFILFLGRGATPPALAALTTFFVSYVAASSGLTAAPQPLRDIMQATGASRTTRFLQLDLPAALPSIVSGMQLAAPSALIGVMVGEWFGAPRGLGVLIINAMQNFQIPLLWSAVLLAMATSLLLFGLLGALQRAVAEKFG